MTITYPLDIPVTLASEVDVEMVDVNGLQVATFTGRDRVQEFEGDYWRMSVTFNNLGIEEGRRLHGFVGSLRKSVGTFVIPFPGYGTPQGAAKDNPSTPLVDGNGQAGNQVLNIKSATPDIVDWLRSGDIVQVGPAKRPHWHLVLTDTSTDSSGNATLDVWPRIRTGTINNDPVLLENPLGLCRLVDAPTIPIRFPVLYSYTFTAREVTGG